MQIGLKYSLSSHHPDQAGDLYEQTGSSNSRLYTNQISIWASMGGVGGRYFPVRPTQVITQPIIYGALTGHNYPG